MEAPVPASPVQSAPSYANYPEEMPTPSTPSNSSVPLNEAPSNQQLSPPDQEDPYRQDSYQSFNPDRPGGQL